jgi:hypothetical protein
MPAWYGARRLLTLDDTTPVALWRAASGILPPFASETRAGSANYFDSLGSLASASTDVARFDYTPDGSAALIGWLLESTKTNGLRNSTMQGAVAGSPGTLPTNWFVLSLGTLTQTIATGTEYGMPYIDLRFNGTTSTTSLNIAFEAGTQIAALTGQTWTGSMYARLAAGSLSNITNMQIQINERNGAGSSLAGTAANFTPSSTLSRPSVTRTFNQATTAFTSHFATILFSSGVAIDVTLRIYQPQTEQGAFASSAIPTTGSAVVRAADVPAAAMYSNYPAIIQYKAISTGTRARKVINPWSGFSSESDEWIESIAIYPIGTPSASLNSKLTVDGGF